MAYTNIDDPSAHFQVETYTGAGANTSVTFSGNSDLKPDFLWLKNRTAGYAHAAFDSNRNLGSAVNAPFLEPNATSTENSNQNWWNSTNNGINTDGFQFGSVSEHNLNNLNSEYVAWAWKANGGTTSSNTDGYLTSTVQANTTAGFSILTFTTDGNTRTVGHGLGVKPDVIWIASRNVAGGFLVITDVIDGSMDYGVLRSTNAFASIGYNAPTSTVFEYNDNNTNTQVAYCFAQKQGYSKFGSYTGNGNANGTFVYTGFKPAFVIVKRSDTAGDSWAIFDNKRSDVVGANVIDKEIAANESSAEYDRTNANMDFLSNGFKLRNTDGWHNASGDTYFYMAFAENPFVTSTGTPTTAR